MRSGLLVACVCSALGITGCRPTDRGTAPTTGLTVAVSIVPQAWLVRQVAGEATNVVVMVPPNQSPHTFEPSDTQVSQVMRAAIFFRIGASLENSPWFQAMVLSKKLRVVDLREGIALREDPCASHDHPHDDHGHRHDGHEHHHEDDAATGQRADPFAGKDPHIWLSPRLLKAQAATVARALGELDPGRAGEFQRNLAAVQKRLDQCDQTVARTLEPLRGKPFFVFHPAWGYFAEDYGLIQLAIEVAGKEPTDREFTMLQQQLRQHKAKAVFVQPQVSDRGARAVADALGVRLERLDPFAPDPCAALPEMAEMLVKSY